MVTERAGPNIDWPVVLGVTGGVGLIGWAGWLFFKRPTGTFRPGDTLSFSKVSFQYMGRDQDLYMGWGLKAGTGDYNNGENLLGGLWSHGGPMSVQRSGIWKTYSFIPEDDFVTQPEFYLDPDVVTPARYEPYIWLNFGEPSILETHQVFLGRGNWLKII